MRQERDVLVDMPAGPYNDPRRALIHGDMKLTVSNGAHFELYDLAADPDEANDLADDPRAKELEAYYALVKAQLHEIEQLQTRLANECPTEEPLRLGSPPKPDPSDLPDVPPAPRAPRAPKQPAPR